MSRAARPRLSRQPSALCHTAVGRGVLVALAVLAAMAGLPSQSWANCAIRSGNLERTPDANLTDNGNGTVTDTVTGLMWKKCPEGRTYSAGNCSGTTGSYPWQASLRRAVTDTTGGNSDWRLPSRTELLSIIETACTSPTINTTRFPNVAASTAFWTSTHAGATMPDSAYAVRFSNGTSFAASKDFVANARLVRAGNTVHDSYRAAAPSEPAAFSFASQIANPGDTVTSNTVTISGLTASRAISITGGQYKIGAGAWTSANGTIANGNTLQLRVTAPNTVPSSTSATVNVNGRTASFLITTGTAPPDSLPDPFAFVDQTGVMPSTLIVSAPISVLGINLPTDISITGGEYEINSSGAWTSAAGIVLNHDSVSVRHTSSASHSTAVNTVLTIGTSGTVSDTFTSTTGAFDATPDAFAFTDQGNVAPSTSIESNDITVSGINAPATISITGTDAQYQIDGGSWTSSAGTVTNGQTVKIRHTSSASYSTAVNATLTIGGVSDTFTTTTAALDATPDAFAFTDQIGVTPSTLTTSDSITVSGINSPVSIAVIGGEYEKNSSGTWANGADTVVNGDTVRVRHTSSASYSTAVNTTLTIGGVQDTFTSTTLAAPGDTVPDTFGFTDQNPVALSTLITSNTLTVSGISAAASISVTSGEYQIDGGAWTSTVGSITNGQSFAVRHTSSAAEVTATNTTLNIGGVTDVFTSTTGDKTPNAFSFTDQTPVALSTVITSNTLTLAGITVPATISVSGGEYQIDGGTWTSTAGTISDGQTFAVRHTSSASQTTVVNTTLTIGGTVSDTFTSTTGDSIPAAFTFTDQTNVVISTPTESNAITVSGITVPTSISVSGAAGSEYQINGSAWASTAGTVSNGNTVKVRHTSSASYSTVSNTTLTIGGVSDTFTTTTQAPPCSTAIWEAVTYSNTSGDKSNNYTHPNVVTLTGLCPNTAISMTSATLTRFRYSINGGTQVNTAGQVQPGNILRLHYIQNNNDCIGCTVTVTIGGVSKSWRHSAN